MSMRRAKQLFVLSLPVLAIGATSPVRPGCPHEDSKYKLTFPADYDPDLPDVNFTNETNPTPLNISVHFIMDQLQEVRDFDEDLTLSLILLIFWRDSRYPAYH